MSSHVRISVKVDAAMNTYDTISGYRFKVQTQTVAPCIDMTRRGRGVQCSQMGTTTNDAPHDCGAVRTCDQLTDVRAPSS